MAAAELVFVGTHTGDFAGIPATGKQVAVPYAAFYDLADAKITALRIEGFVTGLVAALTAEATPASTTAPLAAAHGDLVTLRLNGRHLVTQILDLEDRG